MNNTTITQTVTQEKKKLNLFDIFCLGLSGAIGSGIFVLMGLGIGATGRSIVLVCVVGVLFMLLAYWFNVLLGSMFVFRGGDYSQKALAFNPLFTGVSAYVTFLNSFGLAMYGVGIVSYASVVMPGIVPYTKIIAITIITLFFAATIKGSKFVARLNSVMTVVLIASIAVFIFMGIPKVQSDFFTSDGFFTGGLGGFITAIALMGWACQGTTMAPTSMYAVTKNPKRTIPGGILLICLALAVIYGLMALVASGVLPLEAVVGQNLSVVAKEIFPHSIFVVFILGGAVFAIATSMLGGIAMVRYPIQKVAEDGWLPKVFTKTTKGGYPFIVYGVYYLLSIFPVLLGFSLDVIVSLVMIPCMIMNVYCNLACIKIIKDHPQQWEKSMLHMPNGIMYVICVLGAICAGVVCYNLFAGLVGIELWIMIGLLAICFICSIVCLKTGKVSKVDLEENKRQILADAYAMELETEEVGA